MENTRITFKNLKDLKVGDKIIGLGNTDFKDVHTINKIRQFNGQTAIVTTDRGGFYPVAVVGNAVCKVVY